MYMEIFKSYGICMILIYYKESYIYLLQVYRSIIIVTNKTILQYI